MVSPAVAQLQFLNLGFYERVAIMLLDLASDFGVEESRGTLLKASFSHEDIFDLAGRYAPGVTEHMAERERMHLVIRQICSRSYASRT